MKTSDNTLRVLTAVPICDGHDSAINTINLELIRNGVEVIYLGYHRSVRDVVRAAVQEDVRAVGISSYNSGHVEFFSEVVAALRKEVGDAITVFGGGGGTITREDARIMQKRGVDQIFFAGTSLEQIITYVKSLGGKKVAPAARAKVSFDHEISAKLRMPKPAGEARVSPPTIGITGPGGAGKTTLIDELVLRYLKRFPQNRVAILSHDPSIVGNGALLGDRATMIHSQHDRVFMRSLATRGRAGGLSPQTEPMLAMLKRLPFDLIILETVGTGQEAMPFTGGGGLVDSSLFVMSPEYGSKLQLQKIAMLDIADMVIVNKGDLAGAPRAAAEVEQRLHLNRREQQVFTTQAKRHRDKGVDQLFESLTQRMNTGHESTRGDTKQKKTKSYS